MVVFVPLMIARVVDLAGVMAPNFHDSCVLPASWRLSILDSNNPCTDRAFYRLRDRTIPAFYFYRDQIHSSSTYSKKKAT
jgi:hypothetical protein